MRDREREREREARPFARRADGRGGGGGAPKATFHEEGEEEARGGDSFFTFAIIVIWELPDMMSTLEGEGVHEKAHV